MAMDPSTAVRTDTLPAIATLVVPGALASGGYVWIGLGGAPQHVLDFLARQEALSTIGAVLVSVAVGFAIDSAGSYVEVYAFDRRRPDRDKMIDHWWKYLTIAWTNEPTGQHYLRRLLVSFKFELNMFVAVLVALPSVPTLVFYNLLICWRGWVLSVGLVAAAVVFFYFAKSSSDVLADVRRHLVEGVWEPKGQLRESQGNVPKPPASGTDNSSEQRQP